MKQKIQTRSPMLPLLLGMLFGLNLAKNYTAPLALLMSLALIGSIATLVIASKRTTSLGWVLCFLASTILISWSYGHIRLPRTPSANQLALPEREAHLTLEIQRVLQPTDRYGKTSGIARVLQSPTTSRIQSKDAVYFQIKLPESATFQLKRGLQLQATGVLTPIPHRTDDVTTNDFEAYLTDIGVHYRFNRTADLQLTREPSSFQQFCTNMNTRFQRTLRLGTPEESKIPNVYVAMLLGRKIDLTHEQLERYRMSGTMHFFAISGLHIGVIATVIAQFLLFIRVPRAVSPCIGLPLLFLFVEITGSSPSAMRAFLMAAFVWASFAFQRQRSPYAALIASAVLVLIINPNQLWSLGFQLSYTVVLSILLFGLPLHQLLTQKFAPYRWLPEDNWNLRQRAFAWSLDNTCLLFSISFSAWLASTPLSAGLFEFISIGAILLNMLLVNLAALVICGGVISLASGSALLPLMAGFINHSAWLIISAMDYLISIFALIPYAVIQTNGFPLHLSYGALMCYFMTLLWLHQRQHRLSSHAMWLPPSIIISSVTAGLLSL